MHWALALGIVSLLLICLKQCHSIGKKWDSMATSLPPGPKGLPVVGNLLHFWRAQSEGSMNAYLLSLHTFGEMTTLHMGSCLWVLINSDRVAEDILTRKSAITSERPHMPVASGLVSNGRRSVIQKSATWREARRCMHQLLHGPTAKTFAEWQELESLQMLLSYLQEPKKWYLHQSRYATAVIYGVITGDRLDKSEEQLIEYRQITREFLESLFVSAVDFFPALERIPTPLQIWRGRWEAIGKFHRRVFEKWWEPIKSKIDSGAAEASWVRDVLLNPRTGFQGPEDDALYLTNSILSAGGDNPRMALNTFVMASIHCPGPFRRCREEIDGVCGAHPTRLPRVQDIESLPYVCAFVKEILRWRPTVPLIPPHQLIENLKYDGFIFPKGTNFVINTVAMCANCQDPESFRPERWLDGHERSLTHGFWGFGGGRRVCVGYKAAQSTIFLAAARLVFCFDFQPASAPLSLPTFAGELSFLYNRTHAKLTTSIQNGKYDSTRLHQWSTVEPFPVRVRSRSQAHEQLISKAAGASGLRMR